ncbi:hypothetical protein IMG5_099940 [Ichthyophthirius multifiliis]|uniref:Striatin N-terminal domain-containing protein n=1 Tax=Ichthyophthirius multifiliis TaxID=5932 RepID=G0QS92_ICHMU|nr:hypothetical protein IMG5_099940 [Ichthyophthirius multifiliis]EGR31914.1 hypothetical protein IMG5_099940 [Ichthyophthirius multifiliis]|eukprot:XP_004035400.1 hypothetical protein IMG5_099940 [Ichthyophthirius multifiliis]
MSQSFEDSQQINVPQTTSYNWLGVLKFLQDQYKEMNYKETEQTLEKQQNLEKISQLEGELKAQENINKDLLKRIKMLEFALRQERIRYSKLLQGQNIPQDIIKSAMQDENNMQLIQNNLNIPQIPQRKAKSHRPLLLKLIYIIQKKRKYLIIYNYLKNFIRYRENDIPNFNNNNNNGSNLDNSFVEFNKSITNQNKNNETQKNNNTQKQQINNSKIINKSLEKYDENIEVYFLKNNKIKFIILFYLTIFNNKRIIKKVNQIYFYIDGIFLFLLVENNQYLFYYLQSQLRSHFDGVRDCYFTKNNTLVTVSEDCMVKLWDTRQFQSSNEETHLEPFYTLREHTGHLYAISGLSQEICSEKQSQIVFTSGSEGIIKVWDIPQSEDVDTYGPTENKNYCVGSWSSNEEPIWQILGHPFEVKNRKIQYKKKQKKQILVVSADGTVKLWEIMEEFNKEYVGNCRQTYVYKQDNKYGIPTSASWIYTNLNLLAVSYLTFNNITIFDKETGKGVNVLRYNSDFKDDQIFRFIAHPNMKILLSAHEDKYIRFFDINQKMPINHIQAHNDAVTSLAFHQDKNYVSSTGHDGFIKTWDLRQYKCVSEIKAHQNKYDEAVHSIIINQNYNYIASCGADGYVNIYNSSV